MCYMEAILFVGPPCCGQETYYYQHYVNVARCCEAEEFHRDSSLNLHLVIQKIVDLIRKHGKVVIDNDHLVTETRTDVVRGIKRKLPDCLLNCVNFIPQHDSIQCLWSLNWLLARNVIAKENDGLSDDLPLSMYELKAQISSSSTSIVLTLDLEEYDSVVHLESPFICSTHYKLTCPVLLFEWRAIQDPLSKANTSSSDSSVQQQHALRPRVKKICQMWRDSNKTGHVIVLCENTPPSASDAIMTTLSQLTQDLSGPIHCLVFLGTISLQRNPVSWIQYLFHINLNHRASLLVFQSRHYQSIGKEMGIRTLLVTQVTDSPYLAVSRQCSEMQVPQLLHSVVYSLPPPQYSCQHTALPLFSRAKKLHESEETTSSATSCVYVDVAVLKLRLVMFYHDYSALESHEQSCRQALVPVSAGLVEYNTTTAGLVYSAQRIRSRSKNPFSSLGSPVSVPVDYSDLPPATPTLPLPTSTVKNTKRPRILPLWLIKEVEASERKRKCQALSTGSSSKTPRLAKPKPVQVMEKSTLPTPSVPSTPGTSKTACKALDDLFDL